jgi:suppressor of G2 allele of SKP1
MSYEKAVEALQAKQYEQGLELLDEALQENPKDSKALARRSACHLALGHPSQALHDAQSALDDATSAEERGIAYLSLGLALYDSRKLPEAMEAFQYVEENLEGGLRGNRQDRTAEDWIQLALDRLGEIRGRRRGNGGHGDSLSQQSTRAREDGTSKKDSGPKAGVKKPRHEFYQSESLVYISIFAKNVQPGQLEVEFKETQFVARLKLGDFEEDWLEWNFDPLFDRIVPAECSFEIMTTKIEFKLRKALIGLQWPQIGGTSLTASSSPAAVTTSPTPAPVGTSSESSSIAASERPVYPSSSKKKLDWDALAKETEKEDEEDKPQGEQALNALFQQIYANSSEDVKRAMMKSFVESNGTCLSTNWEEVGSKTVPITPPDGMTAKAFEK